MIIRIILILFVLIIFGCKQSYDSITIAAEDVLNIYDGDTITIKCLEGFECNNKGKISIRITNVDTAEIRGKCQKEKQLARLAKQHTVAFIRTTQSITLLYDNSNQYDRYGRLLADIVVDNIKLSDSLIRNKLGRKYHGGKRAGWCD